MADRLQSKTRERSSPLELRQSLLRLSPTQRQKLLASLPEDTARALLFDWTLAARDKQLAPLWPWVIWLICAGRGFGKTRTGAEWTRGRVESGKGRRLIIAGPTAADVRDTMVEGESGILSVSPPWFRPKYEPSKARLTWPNGAIGLCMSADEPDRFRGKQCFVAGTKIATNSGELPIEAIAVGDLVLTRMGYRRVAYTMSSLAVVGRVKFSDGVVLVGTHDHPVWSEGAWWELGCLSTGSKTWSGALEPTASSCRAKGITAVSVVSTWEPVGVRQVYNLTVEQVPEYFANDVLVHNCDSFWADEAAAWRFPEAWDQLQFGFRLGDPQGIVTTTPRPTKLVKDLLAREGSDVAVTRGTTYENRANLARSFFDAIVRAYEGTRLGRQELDAEVLEDNPGALWQRDRIDKLRVREAPALRRVVVAIDPAVSTNPKSNETGIVVCGVGEDEHGYVLDDLSGVYTPAQWAARAVKAFDDWEADKIIGETNNGGDLVEANVRTARADIAYEGVHASRGKRARCEPVAALDEQGKVHHVGCLAKLEDQMCAWDPANDDESPDRIDARTWGLSFLMLRPQSAAFEIEHYRSARSR